MNSCSSWDRYTMVQQFSGSEGHRTSSQPLEEAGWLAERSLLSHDFQERRKISGPTAVHHLLCNFSSRGVLAKQVQSCPCFARIVACTLQERYKGGTAAHHGPPLSFLVPLYTRSPIMFGDLLLAFSSAWSAWLAGVCSSAISIVFWQELPTCL